MAFYATVATIISTAIGAYSQHQQGVAAEKAAEYNNRLAQQEATNTELENMEQIKRQRIQNDRKMAEIRTRLANNGTLSTEGTPLAILGESSANFELAIQDSARQANMQAAAQRAQGAMDLWQGEQAESAGNLNALATGVGGIASATETYEKYKPTPNKTGNAIG